MEGARRDENEGCDGEGDGDWDGEVEERGIGEDGRRADIPGYFRLSGSRFFRYHNPIVSCQENRKTLNRARAFFEP